MRTLNPARAGRDHAECKISEAPPRAQPWLRLPASLGDSEPWTKLPSPGPDSEPGLQPAEAQRAWVCSDSEPGGPGPTRSWTRSETAGRQAAEAVTWPGPFASDSEVLDQAHLTSRGPGLPVAPSLPLAGELCFELLFATGTSTREAERGNVQAPVLTDSY